VRGAYVDSSCVVALAFGEPGAERLGEVLKSFEALYSSPLLEAELRSALAREKIGEDPARLLESIDWVHVDRPLTAEIRRALAAGYLRGADLWHVACALLLSPEPDDLWFLTLDRQQRETAAELGFRTEASVREAEEPRS